jgi:hypothetical protein
VAVDKSILSFDLTEELDKEFSETSSGIDGYLQRRITDDDDDDEDDDEDEEGVVRPRPPPPNPVSALGMTFNGKQEI